VDHELRILVKQTAEEEVLKQQILLEVCRTAADKILESIVQRRVNLISKGAIWNHQAKL